MLTAAPPAGEKAHQGNHGAVRDHVGELNDNVTVPKLAGEIQCTVLSPCSALARRCHGGTAADAPAKFVAPLPGRADTFAVARIDLTALDVDAAVERIVKMARIDSQEIADPRRAFGKGLAAFRKAGVTELYARL